MRWHDGASLVSNLRESCVKARSCVEVWMYMAKMRPTRRELGAIDPNGIMHMHRCDVPLDDAPSGQPPVARQRGDSQPGWRSNLNCWNDVQFKFDTIFI